MTNSYSDLMSNFRMGDFGDAWEHTMHYWFTVAAHGSDAMTPFHLQQVGDTEMTLITENSQEAVAIEKLIDSFGLFPVVAAVIDICYAKAEHVETAWQDGPLTEAWSKAATILDKAAFKLPKLP